MESDCPGHQDDPQLDAENASAGLESESDGAVGIQSFETVERRTYESALKAAGGNISAASRILGITRAQLDYRLKKLGIDP